MRYGVCIEGGLKAADTRHRRLRCDDYYCEYTKAIIYASFELFNAWRAIIRTGPKRGTIFRPRHPSTRSNLRASERGLYIKLPAEVTGG